MAATSNISEVAALKRQIRMLQDEITDVKAENIRLKEQLYDKSRELSEVQERLTVAEQVTAATQRRELDEEGHSLQLTTDHVYEKLRRNLEEEHIYTKLLPIAQKETLRELYTELTTTLDARVVAANMYQRNALTLKELQRIQSLRDRPVEAAETLLNFIMEQPDAVFLCFLDVLKHTEQQHIYQSLAERGYQDFDDGTSYTSVVLREHYVFLLETLDVKVSGLVGQLYSDHVISAVERDDISAEQTSFRANEKLLSVLSRKSPRQFQLFLDALDNCGQRHVRNVITDRPVTGEEEGAQPCNLAGVREDTRVVGQYEELAEFPESSGNSEAHPGVLRYGTVGQVVHTLPEGEPVWGVTSLDNEIFLLRPKGRDQVEVYDVITYRLQRRLTVPNARGFIDMTSCEHYHCLYIGDPGVECVHRLDIGLDGAATQWPVNGELWGLSVNAAHNVIATCRFERKIKEFSSHGDLRRELTLPDDVVTPRHTIQSRSGQFIVCHGDAFDPINRVCMISADGRHIVHSHGGQRGSDIGQYRSPRHLAIDDNECVYVVDVVNRRVTLLSSTLSYIREVVSSDQLKWHPSRLYLDVQGRRLYVTDNEWKAGKSTAGRDVVFSV